MFYRSNFRVAWAWSFDHHRFTCWQDYDREGSGLITERDFTEVGMSLASHLPQLTVDAVSDRMLERNPMDEMLKAFKVVYRLCYCSACRT